MTDLGLSLPLRIRRLRDAIGITDAAGRTAAYVYFAGDPDSQASTKRVGPVQAEAIARVITQALKDSLLAGLDSDEEPQPERGASADIAS
ncbi:hypothetical protein [Methylobacterium sp. PvR107]|uniref:hypothetical protein n=1 Tax=Methylobacterium sp. PvR107 TaxID=2806597 RepID=UPI001AE3F999|nr:hypothetical protein [Methylobacterium sp. PvR107]MBP1182251.1 hypothetical protein [Methylobacterium sp. PvR107]